MVLIALSDELSGILNRRSNLILFGHIHEAFALPDTLKR